MHQTNFRAECDKQKRSGYLKRCDIALALDVVAVLHVDKYECERRFARKIQCVLLADKIKRTNENFKNQTRRHSVLGVCGARLFMSSRLLQQTATTMSGKTLVTGLTWRQHVARVRTLYRRTLKLNFQYAFTRYDFNIFLFTPDGKLYRILMVSLSRSLLSLYRPAFNVLCEQTRAEFEAKKHLKEFGEIDAVYAEAESQLFVHPETYTLGWDRGGTAFMRNPPPGFQVPCCIQYPVSYIQFLFLFVILCIALFARVSFTESNCVNSSSPATTITITVTVTASTVTASTVTLSMVTVMHRTQNRMRHIDGIFHKKSDNFL
jgi:hypothetical protein